MCVILYVKEHNKHNAKDDNIMNEWVDVTNSFDEEDRHYKNLYMEINEVFDDVVELSLFSCEEGPYEIYFSYDRFYGIIYADASVAQEKRNKIKQELEAEYRINKRPTSAFINDFAAKYDVQLPSDIYFDFNLGNF